MNRTETLPDRVGACLAWGLVAGAVAGTVEGLWSYIFGYNVTLVQMLWIAGFDWLMVGLIFLVAGLLATLAGRSSTVGIALALGLHFAWAGFFPLIFLQKVHRRPADPLSLALSVFVLAGAVLVFLLFIRLGRAFERRPFARAVYVYVLAAEIGFALLSCQLRRMPAWSESWVVRAAFCALLAFVAWGAGYRLVPGLARSALRPGAALLRAVGHTLVVLSVMSLLLLPVAWWNGRKAMPLETPYAAGAQPPGGDRVNVLLIVIDTVRADRLNSYGGRRDLSPNLQRFAESAVVFERAVAPSAYSLPSHASLFTGLYPIEHQCDHHTVSTEGQGEQVVPTALAEDQATVTEMLADRGYHCGAISANSFYITRKFNFDQGFHYYDDRHGNRLWFYPRMAHVGYRLLGGKAGGVWDMDIYRDAEVIVDEAVNWLDDTPEGHPYFLFLNLMDAHYPYTPPEDFYRRFAGGAGSDWMPLDGEGYAERQQRYFEIRRDRYDGEIAYLDHQLGRFFRYLESRPDWERTMVVVTSDHGESQGERGKQGHGWSLYAPEIWVPMMVRLPGEPGGRRERKLVELTDVVPTILEVCGFEPGRELSGASMLGGEADDLAVCVLNGRGPEDEQGRPSSVWAYYAGGRKLVINTDRGDWLFDYDQSMADLEDLKAHDPGALADLSAQLEQWIAENTPEDLASGDAVMDEKTLGLLKAVGYIE